MPLRSHRPSPFSHGLALLVSGAPAGHGRRVIAPELLALLRCPQTRQPLRLATEEELGQMNPRPPGALVREDGRVAYPICEELPMLLAASAVPLRG